MTFEAKPGRAKKRSKQPKPATPERLQKAALAYLERYATSSENLRQVLARRVYRSVHLHGPEKTASDQDIDDLIGRYVRAGLLDDGAYARAKAVSLSRAGNGSRAIQGKLRAKGLSDSQIEQALTALTEEIGGADADLVAALRHAKRRRLGPFGNGDPERRQRDMAALARRGFSLDLVRLILEAEDEEMLADRLTDRGVDLYAL